MSERPILFSAPMVRAILAGQKTMTRRVIREFPLNNYRWGGWIVESSNRKESGMATVVPETNHQYCFTGGIKKHCPYGQVGDRLWVRETWGVHYDLDNLSPSELLEGTPWYRADQTGGGETAVKKWRPSIHMPRWASRILLEITEIRVERLQDISEEDALDEGIREETNIIVGASCAGGQHREITGDRYFYDGGSEEGYETPIIAFRELWESINVPGSWDANPWVWVVCFRRIDS